MNSLAKQNRCFFFRSNYLNVFCLCLITATVFFLPFLILDKGYFLYYGDYNVQQIPFYRLAQEAVKEGNIFWNWNTDLGANFIGSYSFYLLGSPFFWLTVLFPESAVPYLMAPLLILKFACAGVTGFGFIKRFTRNENFAVLGGLLYALSGFNIYNIFFNHFHEAVIVFPLLLIALEETVINRRRGWFALTVALCAVTNYFFFFGQVVFVLIYFLIRCRCQDFTITWKKFFLLGFEAVLGVFLSCFLLLPSLLAILDNPRTENIYNGMGLFFYSNEQRYGLILESLFLPPDIPARPNFFPDSNAKWASVSAYLPLFSMTGVAVFCKNQKKNWITKILSISLIMALIPFLNSIFHAFNANYYARWFYMPTLLMALATCISLEKTEWEFSFGIKVCSIAIFIFSLIGIAPKKDENDVLQWFSIPEYPERFWGYIAIAVLSIFIILILFYLPRHSKLFLRSTAFAICFVTVIYSVMMIASGRLNTDPDVYEKIVEQGIHGTEKISLDEEVTGFYRIDEDQALDNMPMHWGLPTIQCFHSIVPASIMEFYDSIGVDRSVASRPETKYYALRGLTSVKYLFCPEDEKQPYLPGFTEYAIQNGYQIYENNYFIPMGFTYDSYVDETTFDNYTKDYRDFLMLKAIYLSDKDIEKYGHLLSPFDDNLYPQFSESDYYQTCMERKNQASYHFSYDNRGFTSQIQLEKENLVFFSVPYDKGWSATVNGKPVEIIKANVGFMAVAAPAGDNEIIFTYQTPGLSAGMMISLFALLLLIGYLLLIHFLRKKNPEKYRVLSGKHRNNYAIPTQSRAERAYLISMIEKIENQQQK